MNGGHKWYPIRDYDVDPTSLGQGELAALAKVWQEERERLADSEALPKFNEKLRREWAIETGLIERVYDFDRGVTEILIEHGIDAALIPHGAGATPETIASMIRDHEAAIDYVFAFVKDERPLSTSYVKELHALLTPNQETAEGRDQFGNRMQIPLLKGDYKRMPNNPTGRSGDIHEYCPPEQVASEMDALIEMHRNHVDIAPAVEAAWLHHRFAQIHPFQDGNGRVARSLATMVLVNTVFVDGASDHDARSHYFRQQIVAGAKALEYFANMETYRAWVRLVIHNANQSQLLIAFHGIGHEFRGVLACCAVFFQRVQTDRNDRESGPAKALARAVFQVNYREDPQSIEDRFRAWLEECIVAGLSDWRTADL